MSFVKNLWDSSKRHSQPRMIEKEPQRKTPTAAFYITVQEHHFRWTRRQVKVGRWTSLSAGVMIETDLPVVVGFHLSVASMFQGLTGLCG